MHTIFYQKLSAYGSKIVEVKGANVANYQSEVENINKVSLTFQ